MVSLPITKYYWRVQGAADDAWNEETSATFDVTPSETLLEFLSVGVSEIAIKAVYPWYSDEKADGINPTLFLDFVNNRFAVNDVVAPFSDLFTFTRSTTKNVFNSSGVLESVAIDTPAFDYDPVTLEPLGLLVEEQRTNLCLRSDTPFTNWVTVASTVTASASNFLGFTNGAHVASNGADWHRKEIGDTPWTSGTTYAWTLFVKAGTGGKILINLRDVTAAKETRITGTLGATLTVSATAAGAATVTQQLAVQGGYILTGTFTPNSTTVFGNIGVGPNSNTSGDSINVYAAQLEAGAFPTSYIPTTTGAVTRGADSVVNNASNVIPFADWYNQVEGCLFTEAKAAYNTATTARRVAEISDGTTNNRWINNIEGSAGNNLSVFVNSGGVTQFSGVSALTPNEFRKFASAIKTGGSYAIEGVIIGTDVTVTMPASVSQLNIGQSNGANRINGWIKSLRYYPARITNSELERITL